MSDEKKCCNNCRWFALREKSVIGYGECKYPVSMLPQELRYSGRVSINKDDGTDCPCFERKEVK